MVEPPMLVEAINYEAAQEAVLAELVKWAADGGAMPRFLLPPTDVQVFGRIEMFGEHLAGNDAARELLKKMAVAGAPHMGATLRMLEQVLQLMEYPVERMGPVDFRRILSQMGPSAHLAVAAVTESGLTMPIPIVSGPPKGD